MMKLKKNYNKWSKKGPNLKQDNIWNQWLGLWERDYSIKRKIWKNHEVKFPIIK